MDTMGPETTGFMPAHLAESILFEDRAEAGRALAKELTGGLHAPVVVGVTRGGVEIGAEVAAALRAPLDVVVVAPIRRPAELHTVGAAAPGEAVHVLEPHELSPTQLVVATARARREAEQVDARLHERRPPLDVRGRDVVLVDEAITTGATMAAGAAWARAREAGRVVGAVPVAAAAGLVLVREAVDELVCLYEFEFLGSRAVWFGELPPLADEDVRLLLEATR
jgi:putative phosphoribosyl transferase